MSNPLFQKKVFERVLLQFPKLSDSLSPLARLLNVGSDAVRRRINGTTVLSTDELAIIMRQFNISFDELVFENSPSLLFNYSAFPKEIKTFEDFINRVEYSITTFGTLPNFSAYYATNEIPIFMYFFYPKLLGFKMYIHGLTAWDMPYLKTKKFNFNLFSPNIQTKALEIAHLYAQLPSKDLWTLGIVDNTLNQIEYLAETEKFDNPEDALTICQELSKLVEHMRDMADKGMKYPPGHQNKGYAGTFDLYFNEYSTTNNTILGIHDQGRVLISTLQHPNFLTCTQSILCERIEHWFKEIISNSTYISIADRRRRDWYFNRLRGKVEDTQKQVVEMVAKI